MLNCKYKKNFNSSFYKGTSKWSKCNCWCCIKSYHNFVCSYVSGSNFKLCTSDMPTTSVDMIVNCMDSHENSFLKDQAWYQSHVKWLKQCRAPVFTIDPPIETVDIVPKWCLYPMLPLARLDMTSQMYLCDLGLPRKVFKDAGVTYRSPFGHKFIIPLHPPSS